MPAVVTFSLHRFDRLAAKIWAFGQMPIAKAALRRVPGVVFAKMMGTGAGAGFSLRPNLSVYTMLCEWPSMEAARAALSDAPIFKNYRAKSAQTATLFLSPVSARGSWDGHRFETDLAAGGQTMPVVALTRATLRPQSLLAFWRRVPVISDDVSGEPAKRFMMGTGEVPWLRQVTFSIWSDVAAMERFARKSASHGNAARLAYAENWFAEYCFMRFNLLEVQGDWPELSDLNASAWHAGRDAAKEQSKGRIPAYAFDGHGGAVS
ncbi:MAG: spheroidene monooxygenase [Roseibium sp.]|nr:spheroidene monooxygenase [Roseibium sp.]